MTALYDKTTNTLKELPEMEKPKLPKDGRYGIRELDKWNKKMAEYNAHIASLRTIPCDPSCREIWADKQVVVENRDYLLEWDGSVYAKPLSPPVEQDELWRELIDILCPDHFPAGVTVEKAKSQFILTKKITP